MAIPFFILAGNFLTHGGVARRMIEFARTHDRALGRRSRYRSDDGGALFAAVSGSSPATVVAIGSIMLPAMLQVGYPKRFAAGVIVTGGALGNPDPAVDHHGDLFGGDIAARFTSGRMARRCRQRRSGNCLWPE